MRKAGSSSVGDVGRGRVPGFGQGLVFGTIHASKTPAWAAHAALMEANSPAR